ncbi:MAG: hypothetical protein MJ157_06380, partial [Clostridia bacterium]|nr:hypothetical protein [Clostridia bacterium]
SGSAFSCPEGEYNFFPAILTDEFSTINSTNLAGAGSVYLWLPALIPASAPDDLPFYLLDNQGLRSEPFRSYPSNEFTLPQDLPEITVPTGQKLIYTLFKVSKAAAEFYLIGTFQGEEAAWPLPFSA